MNAPIIETPHVAAPAPFEAWPNLDLGLLDEQTGAPPPFRLDVLPPLWRAWTEAVVASTNAPADYVALSLLTAAGSLVADRRVAPAPGWAEPCILWTALVGPPSCGKTPAVEAACGLLAALWHQQRCEPRTLAKGITPAPLFTNGTTIDAVLGVLRETEPQGVLLVRDEHGDWLSHLARGTRDGSAHAFWLSAWCQRSLDLGWRGKTVDLDDPSLSILGTTHPDALLPALTRDDGGVLARFLFVRPAAGMRPRPLSEQGDVATLAAVSALRRLREQPWRRRDLPLTDEARDAFQDFRLLNAGVMPDLAGRAAAWWGKGPSQVLRLAGVLTFLDWAAKPQDVVEPEHVPVWAIDAAARLWRDYLWPHAQATFRIAGAGGERESRQRQVLRWLAAQRLPEVSREHIRREALSQALDAAGTQRLIEDLIDGGWLQSVTPAEGGRGRRRRRWQVHPALWGAETASDVRTPFLPPEGEGGAKRRKGDAAVDSLSLGTSASDRTSPFRPFGAPSPSGGRICSRTVRVADSDGAALPVPAVPAISASDNDATKASGGVSSGLDAACEPVAPDARAAVCAIPANEIAAGADSPPPDRHRDPTAITADVGRDDDGVPQRSDGGQHRWRRRQPLAPLRNGGVDGAARPPAA
ncbi:DUF3987 domain-containing protein [Reyranella sp. CPCC 100927]|uniref:DUF3987 domain-containing protein n=1 Tax=Reyranella sp. CPCC 100927 TaxID=2599616 RepID=UPI0011B76100|nr:DUF3987 domain-containing protein [Reyranella sp. CPCC 100927]TWT08647.1 DUF3987 domain-containing protein [Reyranella sp. CPCC 100927]